MKITDWDSYYSKPYKTAKYSRKITGNILINSIKSFIKEKNNFTIIELGGANSCSFQRLNDEFKPKKFIIVDNNQTGLDKFIERIDNKDNVIIQNDNILGLKEKYDCDLAFSLGLIEHFSEQDTRKAIISHFNSVKPGGIVIITFPTPTLLYRMTRKAAEILRLWIFHDERPLKYNEVEKTIKQHGEILHSKIIWSIFLTQYIVVAKKL